MTLNTATLKAVLADAVSVAVSIVAVLTVVAQVGPALHVSAVDQVYIVSAISVLSAFIAQARKFTAAKLAARKQ